MKEGAFMYIDGPKIDGGCTYTDMEGAIEVLQFNHWVNRPVDPNDPSRKSGDRQLGLASFTKDVDKASPLLIQALCEGKTLDIITILWYKQPKEGDTEPQLYFTHKFKKCLITSVRPRMAGGTGGGAGHAWREVVDFGFKQVTWTVEDGGIEFTDAARV